MRHIYKYRKPFHKFKAVNKTCIIANNIENAIKDSHSKASVHAYVRAYNTVTNLEDAGYKIVKI